MQPVNSNNFKKRSCGFTLVELILAMAVSSIVMMAVYTVYQKQQQYYTAQSQVTEMQQNLRAGSSFLARDLRIVAYSPSDSGDDFELLNIKRYQLDGVTEDAANGNCSIQFSADLNDDGVLDPNEIITYSLYDYAGDDDDIADLARTVGAGGRQLVAESVEAMGIAYAFDADSDGYIDMSAGGNIIWAIDSDNDNKLDRLIDTNDDGLIDVNDTAGGAALGGSAIELNQIRAARIWTLAKAKRPDPNFSNSATYVVADKRITAADNNRRRLLEFSVYFRNTGI